MFPVEIFQSMLAKLTSILRAHDIRFHFTVGLIGAAYGEPRMTQDIEIVIDPAQTKAKLESLVQNLEKIEIVGINRPVVRAARGIG